MNMMAIRDSWRALALDTSWPGNYVEVISWPVDPASLPDLWTTLLFETTENAPIGIGPLPNDHRERGFVEAWAVSRSGGGDDPAVQAAEQIRNAIWGWAFPSGMTLLEVGSPWDPVPSADGAWYQVGVRSEYMYDYVQT